MSLRKKSISIITIAAVLISVISGLVGYTGVSFAAANPELPRVYLDTTYSPPTGNTITVNSGGDLQGALNSAQPGDTIVLQAGAAFTGNYTLPNKTSGSGWIYVRSSAYSSLPAPGNRVFPSNAANMPKIVTPNTSPALSTAQSAHNFRFVGVEITTTIATTSYTCYNLVSLEAPSQTQLSQVPTDIVFDRCYIHGTTTGNIRRGIALNSARTAVIDSYISDCHEVGADSQAIGCWNGPGPFKLVNNTLEGAGENVMFGGSDTSIQNMVPSDIEVKGNYFNKPLSWKVGDPGYGGIHWCVKNIFELKNAQRVQAEGNIFDHNWTDGQSGFGIVFTPRNQNGGNPWAVVQDVTFVKNKIVNSENCFNILGHDDNYPSQQTNDILIKDNLVVNTSRWIQSCGDTLNITVDHNTAFPDYTIISADYTPVTSGWEFKNNITTKGVYGIFGSGIGEGNACINYYFPGMVCIKDVLVGCSSGIYPAGNYFPAAISDVGFVNYAGGDYHLAASSLYKNAGTDGKDIGADINALNTAIAGCISGIGQSPTPTPTPTPTPAPGYYSVSSISANRQQTGYEATKAIDDITSGQNPENRWSGDTQFAYITYDLGSSRTVGSVDIDWYNALSQQTKFDIRLSTDGTSYGSPVYYGTCAAQQGYQNYAFTAQTARYVRITGHYNNNLRYPEWISITETRIKDGSGNILTVSSAAANRQQTGYEAAKTIDGITSSQDPENRWSGDSIFAYITCDLGIAKTVSSVDIDWYNIISQQTTFEIWLSTDNVTYARVYAGTGAAVQSFQKYTFTSQPARYVKIVGKANNNTRYPEWISITELRIWS